MRIVTFYRMLIKFTLYGLCLVNEWNVLITLQNEKHRESNDLQKKKSIDFGYEKVGSLQ
jgi:hypothetical protein